VLANAASFLLSAAGIRAIGGTEARPRRTGAPGLRAGDLLDGWRHVLTDPGMRPLLGNTILVAVLMLGQLGFAPWQYGLAFGAPCVGGPVGSRLARPLAARYGAHPVLRVSGTLRACWSIGLAFVQPGAGGLVLVIAVQLGLVTCVGVFTPVFATYRLERTEPGLVARTLAAWSVSSNACVAALTALWGGLAALTGPRTAIAAAGVLMLATPLLLPRRDRTPAPELVGQ
jgi:MFS family permease